MRQYKILQYLLILVFALSYTGCLKEPPLEANALFEISEGPHKAGDVIRFTISGSGEMFALYTGDEGHIYDEYPSSTGVPVSSGSYEYDYDRAGTYTAVCVASSYGNWGEDKEENIKKIDINVIDDRTTLKKFKVGKRNIGIIDNHQNIVIVPVPADADISNENATFETDSPDAVVTVNGVVQTTKVTTNDFTKDIVYTVTAPNGDKRDYKIEIRIEAE